MSDIKTSVLYVSGEPAMVMLDYLISNGNETRYVFSRLSGGRDEFGHVGWRIIDDAITVIQKLPSTKSNVGIRDK